MVTSIVKAVGLTSKLVPGRAGGITSEQHPLGRVTPVGWGTSSLVICHCVGLIRSPLKVLLVQTSIAWAVFTGVA